MSTRLVWIMVDGEVKQFPVMDTGDLPIDTLVYDNTSAQRYYLRIHARNDGTYCWTQPSPEQIAIFKTHLLIEGVPCD